MTQAYEKLGAFYLGRALGEDGETVEPAPLLYDARDLTTHAVCVGMTGSGKTGLCVSLLEEAALDGVPALVIDPKGDLGNLLLTFPALDGDSFLPWVSDEEARRAGVSLEEFARQQADLWRRGLAEWDQGPDRIERLRQAAEFAIYTPGSSAGLPLSILSSFEAPRQEVDDEELYRERIATTVTSLLTLLGVDADPVRSREHILLSNLFDHNWRRKRDLDLPSLIGAIQEPPVERIGVVDVETFFPAKERFELAMRLNALLAAPAFQGWLEGEPLDVDSLLYTDEGRPRLSILSIAHLGESERMFFVSLLLNEVLGWVRSRPGTNSLRALLYMDEVFGYMPPVAEPPSKRPLLTLLKQARAYGLGIVLATQNPVDLDYKGLSNTGTWFLGRLQTERDKERVLDGLEGASSQGGFDRRSAEQRLAGLGKREFWLHSVHEPEPVVFRTRWAMSYLRGPLTRDQIRSLTDPLRAPEPAIEAPGEMPPPAAAPSRAEVAVDVRGEPSSPRPILRPEVPQLFVRPQRFAERIVYRAAILGLGTVHFTNRQRTRSGDEHLALLAAWTDGGAEAWSEAEILDATSLETGEDPLEGASFARVGLGDLGSEELRRLTKELAEHLYRSRELRLLHSPLLDTTSQVGESERDFRIRLSDIAREQRDAAVDELRDDYAKRLARLRDRLVTAEERLEREREQAAASRFDTAVRVGATLISAFLGRKRLSATTLSKAGTSVRGFNRSKREARDAERAEESVGTRERELAELEAELAGEIEALEARYDPSQLELEEVILKPRRQDVRIETVALCWLPFDASADGTPSQLYQR